MKVLYVPKVRVPDGARLSVQRITRMHKLYLLPGGNSPAKIANTYIIAHITASFQKAKMQHYLISFWFIYQ